MFYFSSFGFLGLRFGNSYVLSYTFCRVRNTLFNGTSVGVLGRTLGDLRGCFGIDVPDTAVDDVSGGTIDDAPGRIADGIPGNMVDDVSGKTAVVQPNGIDNEVPGAFVDVVLFIVVLQDSLSILELSLSFTQVQLLF